MTPLTTRAFLVLHHIIDLYLETRLPVGSRTLSQRIQASPATLRTIMAELEEQGFLKAPHRSAGRIPTTQALRVYAEKVAHHHDLSPEDEEALRTMVSSEDMFLHISQTLADLCKCASIFFTSSQGPRIHSLDFIYLASEKAVSILVTQNGHVERHVIALPPHVTSSELKETTYYLNECLFLAHGDLQQTVFFLERNHHVYGPHLCNLALHLLSQQVQMEGGCLEIKGHSHLLETIQDLDDVRTFKILFSWLETQNMFYQLLHHVMEERSLQVFFGLQEDLFNVHGCSVVAAPYETSECNGVIGVIGPLHMDYRRIIPIIESTVKLVEKNHAKRSL